MGKRKIREEKSKIYGTKQVLADLNTSAHEETHREPNGASPTISTFVSGMKWGTGR